MRTTTCILLVVLLMLAITCPVLALTGPVKYQGRYYYVVTSRDATEDTGAKVCAKAGVPYIGYTATTTDICMEFHPTASEISAPSGSSTPFFCNGLPQQGICANQTNACMVCPNCFLGVDANTVIGNKYREMYVECGPTAQQAFRPDVFTWFHSAGRSGILGMYWRTADKQVLEKYLKDRWGCDFYQYPLANRMLVNCSFPGAADAFCQMQLGFLGTRSEYCGTNGVADGLIVCSQDCSYGGPPSNCPPDPTRVSVRGTNAPVGNCPQGGMFAYGNFSPRFTISPSVPGPTPAQPLTPVTTRPATKLPGGTGY